MFRGLFITGTDTDVGKTTVAAALMHRYRALQTLRYWKPVQTGIESSDDRKTVEKLGNCDESELHLDGIRLPRPVAPYLAAEWSGTRVSVSDLIARAVHAPNSVRWIVEGAGGVHVPLNESESMIDLMVEMGMPVLIVARSSLGTINHTLLTIEALRGRKLGLAGVVMAGFPNTDNRQAIERFGNIRVIDEMPQFAPLTPEALGRWARREFDTNGQLERYLR
jgi:malonyl-CoA O-methyltransferase